MNAATSRGRRPAPALATRRLEGQGAPPGELDRLLHRNPHALRRGPAASPLPSSNGRTPCAADLLDSTEGQTFVLHGDMHHFNVLRAARQWLAIDPKGLPGDRCFDVCQFLRNPLPSRCPSTAARLDIFCDELGLNLPRTRDWCLVHAMLDACWDYEDGNPGRTVAYAEETLSF